MNWLYDRADDVREFLHFADAPLLTVIVLCGVLICGIYYVLSGVLICGIHYLTTESPQRPRRSRCCRRLGKANDGGKARCRD